MKMIPVSSLYQDDSKYSQAINEKVKALFQKSQDMVVSHKNILALDGVVKEVEQSGMLRYICYNMANRIYFESHDDMKEVAYCFDVSMNGNVYLMSEWKHKELSYGSFPKPMPMLSLGNIGESIISPDMLPGMPDIGSYVVKSDVKAYAEQLLAYVNKL